MLLLQSAYMLITRATTKVQVLLGDPMPVPTDTRVFAIAKQWTDTLTIDGLFDVYQTSGESHLLVCFLSLYVDREDMGNEIARRFEPQRFTVELVRTQWGDEDRTSEVEKLLNGVKQFAPDLRNRFLKDPMNAAEMVTEDGKAIPSDFDQMAWVAALEWWDEKTQAALRHNSVNAVEELQWIEELPLLVHEQAFFDGPITMAWRESMPKVYADFMALDELNQLPYRVREKREAAVEKVERWDKKRDRPNTSGTEDPDRGEEVGSDLNDSRSERAKQQNLIKAKRETAAGIEQSARASAIDELAKTFGEPAEKLVDLLRDGLTLPEASKKSRIASDTLAAFIASARSIPSEQ